MSLTPREVPQEPVPPQCAVDECTDLAERHGLGYCLFHNFTRVSVAGMDVYRGTDTRQAAS